MQTLTPEQSVTLSRWRARALQTTPFYAPILFALRPVNTTVVGSFAVDEKWRLYINFNAIEADPDFTDDMCAQGLIHECGHIVGDHSSRTRDYMGAQHRNVTLRKIANIANDIAINDWLAEIGLRELADYGYTSSKMGLPPRQTPEVYYDLLTKNRDDDGDGDGDGAPKAIDGCGQGGGGVDVPGGDLADAVDSGVDPIRQQAVMVSTANAIRTADPKMIGSARGDFLDTITGAIAPKPIPWQRILGAHFRRAAHRVAGNTDVSMRRRNRRRPGFVTPSGTTVILPGYVRHVADVLCIRDTSGSMGEELAEATAQISAIGKQLGIDGDHLRFVDADVDIYSVKRLRAATDLSEISGRGGTDMAQAIVSAVAVTPRPDIIVVMTDGATRWPEHPVGVPVIACLIPAGGYRPHDPPSWIKTVRIAM